MSKLKLVKETLRNMGWRYVCFRAGFEAERKLGTLKRKFPTEVDTEQFISLADWKNLPVQYFFECKENLQISKNPNPVLEAAYKDFQAGKLPYFNATVYDIGRDYDWITNPSNDYRYDANKHWLDIPDLSQEAGDIKYVWEKSRFSYIYTLIRYDYHFEEDCSEEVFSEIESWITCNPVNRGPNWRCSQEISLRVMNWLFALHYYKKSPALSESRFQNILHSIYWQLHHVRANINFSRICVRNNHAVTETLMLYLGGLFFPFFPGAAEWKRKGKQWFEEEIAYQVYEDGTFLQFSHNYHRVLIQLLTQAFYLSELNGENFSGLTYERAQRSLNYLYQCTNITDGHLPNYGANDGALFFKLNDANYRDYRPTLNALAYFFNRKPAFDFPDVQEDTNWYKQALIDSTKSRSINLEQQTISSFEAGGYYLMRDEDSFTFIKCGSYKDRPSHADNLHIDLWYKGENILRDAGTYRYNTNPELVRYFNGTRAHNTVSLGDNDQMKKGPRFIWYNWSNLKQVEFKKARKKIIFEGEIIAFAHLGERISHRRRIVKEIDTPSWWITDQVNHITNLAIKQYWNFNPNFLEYVHISATDAEGRSLEAKVSKAWYSSLYGVKESTTVILFETYGKLIKTKIELK